MARRTPIQRLLVVGCVSIGSILLLLCISSVSIGQYHDFVYRDLETVSPAPVALVFGAGVRPDGTLTDALRDRVIAGVELYKNDKVRKIVMTGDNGRRQYDEVTPMKAYAVALGVPEEDIVLDYAGFRTYDSCYRARDVFGLWDVIAVSQEFHLPRILYICNKMRVHTVGYVADRTDYIAEDWWNIRELLAQTKAWVQVNITKPQPRFLGPKEDVF